MRNAHISGSPDSYTLYSSKYTRKHRDREKESLQRSEGKHRKTKTVEMWGLFFRTQKNVRSRSVTTVPDFMEPNSGNPKNNLF